MTSKETRSIISSGMVVMMWYSFCSGSIDLTIPSPKHSAIGKVNKTFGFSFVLKDEEDEEEDVEVEMNEDGSWGSQSPTIDPLRARSESLGSRSD